MEAATADLTSAQKTKLQEVADGLLAVYRTLVRMQYLEPEWIKEGPHDMTPFLPTCEAEDLDASIIYLYSILPYVDCSDARGLDFFKGGSFLDFRDKDSIEYGRDPFYSDEEREKMRPWMTPLSGLGNHRTVIIYDAKKHLIGMFDQESGESSDHNIDQGDNAGEWDSDDGDDDDSDDETENVYDEMEARSAPKVLCDMVRWFEDLSIHPGDGDDSGREWYPEISIPLYRKHGWPGPSFDDEAFRVAQARAAAADSAKWDADEPLRKVEELRSRADQGETYRAKEQRKAIAKAKNLDDEWLARWNLWLEEKHMQNAVRELADATAKAEQLCPGGICQKTDDLPLWELRELRREAPSLAHDIERLQKDVDDAGGAETAPKSPRVRLAWAIKRADVHRRAIEACEVDAGGRSFPPSRGTDESGLDLDHMLEWHTKTLEGSERDIQDVRGWLAQAPESARAARQEAEVMIRRHEEALEIARVGMEKCRPGV